MSDKTEGYDGRQFSRLLRLIVTQNQNALSELKRAPDAHIGGFCCYTPKNAAQTCGCGYDLEYFDFIKGDSVDTERLNAVCENIERGECVHIQEHEQKNEDSESCLRNFTTLLHAAAAVGNVPVAEYLVAGDAQHMYTSSQSGIKPFHLAIIKSQSCVLKCLYNIKDVKAMEKAVFMDRMNPAKRCVATGCWTTIQFPNGVYECNIANLLMLLNFTDTKVVRELVDIFNKLMHKQAESNDIFHKPRLLVTLANLVMGKYPKLAMLFLTDKHMDRNTLVAMADKTNALITTCVLADDDDVLQALISCNFDIQFRTNGYNTLDVAIAFGSKRCSLILRQYMEQTPDIYNALSPYNFLIDLAYCLPHNTNYRDLMRKCAEQGFDVNWVDTVWCCTPLTVAYRRCSERFGPPLLEIGARLDRDKSLLYVLIESYDGRGYIPSKVIYQDTNLLKFVLRSNPTEDPKERDRALKRAVQYDLISTCMETIMSNNAIKFCSDQTSSETVMYANTLNDRFLAVSAYALLHELGFQSGVSDLDFVDKEITLAQHDQDGRQSQGDRLSHCEMYRDYVLKTKETPRSLKSSCRIAIRRAHPGLRLHAYISSMKVPNILAKYVLCPYFLWPTVVEGSITPKQESLL